MKAVKSGRYKIDRFNGYWYADTHLDEPLRSVWHYMAETKHIIAATKADKMYNPEDYRGALE